LALRVGSVGLRLEADGSSLDWLWLFGAKVGLERNRLWIGPAMPFAGQIGRQLTIDLELVRTRGIRLFN
jgi:hypothetical protein